jgi:uncharacterized membrane protein YgdD (TMEM256/DUF423 family)
VLLWLSGVRGKFALAARWLFLGATSLFCGTLYLKALLGWDAAVRLAPFGGVCFMLGWLLVAVHGGTRTGGTDV